MKDIHTKHSSKDGVDPLRAKGSDEETKINTQISSIKQSSGPSPATVGSESLRDIHITHSSKDGVDPLRAKGLDLDKTPTKQV